MMKALKNCQILSGAGWTTGQAVLLEDGRILGLVPEEEIPPSATPEDLNGHYLCPGYIDCQVNGGGGLLFNDRPDPAALQIVAAAHRRYGTTGFLPTLISDSWDKMVAMTDAVETAIAQNMPGILGIHFEGPYLNRIRKGVHDATHIRDFEDRFVNLIEGRNLGTILLTLAPELVPSDLIRRLSKAGVVLSAGHSNATYEEARAAFSAGLSGVTHLFNAMPPLESRKPGLIGAALETESCYCGIINDGHHVHPASLKAAIAAKGPDKMMLVTDAMPTVGTKAGSFTLGTRVIIVEDGTCKTEDGTLAGSNLDMATAVRNSVELLELPLTTALAMATAVPAAFLGQSARRGEIAAGKAADLVLMDSNMQVIKSWIAGQDQS